MQLPRGESGVAKLLEMTDTFIDGPSFNPDPQCNNSPCATTTMSVSESRMIDTTGYNVANTMHAVHRLQKTRLRNLIDLRNILVGCTNLVPIVRSKKLLTGIPQERAIAFRTSSSKHRLPGHQR